MGRRKQQKAAVDILQARRIELRDEHGRTRIALGHLGTGDGGVYGIEVEAGSPAVRACLSAEDRSAGLTIVRGSDAVLECRVSAVEGEPSVSVELGAAGSAVARIDVAHDGTVVASIPSGAVIRRSAR